MVRKLTRSLYIVYFCLFALPVFTVATVLTSLSCAVGCSLGGRRIFAYYPGMLWSRLALFITGCRIKVEGREHVRMGQNYVVAANHQGAYDIFMMYGYLGVPFRWVMKIGIRKIPFVGLACRAAGFIFVDEQRPSSIHKTMREAKAVLAERTSIFIFPEGSRSTTGHLSRFKKGAVTMADELDIPILPVSIDGSYRVLPIGRVIPHPYRLKLTIHPPLRVAEFGEKPQAYIAANNEVRSRIASVLPLENR